MINTFEHKAITAAETKRKKKVIYPDLGLETEIEIDETARIAAAKKVKSDIDKKIKAQKAKLNKNI